MYGSATPSHEAAIEDLPTALLAQLRRKGVAAALQRGARLAHRYDRPHQAWLERQVVAAGGAATALQLLPLLGIRGVANAGK